MEALNNWLLTAYLSMLARLRIRERQVLVDKDPSAGYNHLAKPAELKLVAKANEAIVKMTGQHAQVPGEARVVGAKKLCNSGVVYELNSMEAAQWLRRLAE